MKFAMMTFAAAVGGVNAAEIADPTAWKLGRCYVPDGETLGPQMKDNVDLFGLDWIKYWSANAEHNNGDLDSPKTTSAAACCEACESTPDCNMWTWTKSQQGCYLKSASKQTTYVERFDEGRVSGGWEASVHVDTNTFYGDQKTSTTTQLAAFNTNGVMVNHESTGELHTAATAKGAVDHDVDHLHRRLDAANHLLGVDYPSEDYVKFSNGRPEASTPTSCEEACTAYEKCEYWSWSHNDYHSSCYLKSNLAMADKSYGYGYPTHSCGVVSGFMRGGADGVGKSQPQLVPATILRKNFEFVAAIKPHELPNRPQFYMIGSGITEASLHALTVGTTCSHLDFRKPCFTAEEIEEAITQVKIEQHAFDRLTVAEQVAHTAVCSLAVSSGAPIDEILEPLTKTAGPMTAADLQNVVSASGLACAAGEPAQFLSTGHAVCRDSCQNPGNCEPDGCDGEQKCADVCCGSGWHPSDAGNFFS